MLVIFFIVLICANILLEIANMIFQFLELFGFIKGSPARKDTKLKIKVSGAEENTLELEEANHQVHEKKLKQIKKGKVKKSKKRRKDLKETAKRLGKMEHDTPLKNQ